MAVEAGNLSLEQRVTDLEIKLADAQKRIDAQKINDCVCLVCFSGEWDKLFAAMTIANGALALGQEVHMFFTFWAMNALREPGKAQSKGKSLPQSMLGAMLPTGAMKSQLSKMHFMGLGKKMLQGIMAKSGVDDIDRLIADAKELGGHFYVCETTFDLFGLKNEELADGETMGHCGVATFLSIALKSRVTLFI